MCELLKEQFEKNFNDEKHTEEVVINNAEENEIDLNQLFNDNDDAPFTAIEITSQDILYAIKGTKINSAPGPDSIPPIILHK